MVVPVKTRRGSQMNLKGLYRLNQNCMLKVHLNTKRAPSEAQYVGHAGDWPGGASSESKPETSGIARNISCRNPGASLAAVARAPAGEPLMQNGLRRHTLPSLAPDLVLLLWTLPQVMDLCRRHKQIQGGCWGGHHVTWDFLDTMEASGGASTKCCAHEST